jgi:hypothetical protein
VDDIGWSELEVRAGLSRSFGRDLERDATRASGRAGTSAGTHLGSTMGKRATSTMHHHFTEAAKYVVGPLVAAFTVEKIGEVIGESLHAAADLEAANRRNTLIFGKQREEVDKFGESAAQSYGLADLQARKAASGFGILFKNAGLSRKENAKSSVQLVKLAADLSAFNNVDPATTFTALQRGVAGSTRGLKPLGIIIDSTAIKAEALADGLVKPTKNQAKIHAAQATVLSDTLALSAAIKEHGKNSDLTAIAQGHLEGAQAALNVAMDGTVAPLTAQQKILASRNLILKQTTDQQGAFQRSSGDVIEQQRILSAEWGNAKDAIGKGLMPIERDLIGLLNKELVPALQESSKWFERKGAPALHHFATEAGPLAKQILPPLADGLKAVGRVTGRLAPDVAGIISSFTKLPKPIQDALVVGAGAAYLGKKTGLLGVGMKALSHGGGGGIASDVLSKGGSPAHPLYVWTVNGGGGGVPPVVPGGGGGPLGVAENILKRVPFAPSLAVGAQIAHGLGGVVDAFHRQHATPLPFDPNALAGSHIGGAQGLHVGGRDGGTVNIDFDRLSRSFIRYGSESPYAKQLLAQLKTGASDTGGGVFGNNGTAKDQNAIRDLQEAMSRAGAGLHPRLKAVATDLDSNVAAIQRESRALDLLGHGGRANLQALVSAADVYRKGLARLPDKVQTQVLTPGLVTSRTDIEHLQAQYRLTPKQVTTLYKLLGLDKARADFDGLQNHMGQHRSFTETIELAGHTPAGINVHGDLHIHGDERTRQEQTRRNRQRAYSDGVRRGGTQP